VETNSDSTGGFLSYNKLAWIEPILSPPEQASSETELYCRAIKKHSKIRTQTLLHIGCGAGINDYTFKKHFKVTGVDISEGMLEVAKIINPDIEYIRGDMRTVRLGKTFDAVTMPDSVIGYMTTKRNARKAVTTAYKHLNIGGVFLMETVVAEDFRENNFVYTGKHENLKVTVFENNGFGALKNKYEAAIIYLIRNKSKLEIYTDKHIIGLFNLADWFDILQSSGFRIKYEKITCAYDRFIMEEGKYTLTMFVCIKT